MKKNRQVRNDRQKSNERQVRTERPNRGGRNKSIKDKTAHFASGSNMRSDNLVKKLGTRSRRDDRVVSGRLKRSEDEDKSLLIGRNPINEALRAGQAIDKVWVLRKDERGRDKRLSALIYDLKRNDAVILEVDRKSLDRLADNQSHQGIVAQCPAHDYLGFEELLEKEMDNDSSFLILLDRIQDPHNLGAILRVADTVGVGGIIIPKHESVGLNYTVAKSSAGAVSYVPVSRVQNLGQTVDRLRELGYWILAADMDGENLYTSETLSRLAYGKVVLMIGNEGKGLADKLKERADLTLSIPMKGKISSLNASVSTAVVAYEVFRRRLISSNHE